MPKIARNRFGLFGGLGAAGLAGLAFAAVLTRTAAPAGRLETAAPEPPPAAEAAAVQPLEGPWTVAIQPGHWLVEQLPDELARLRGNTGTAYGGVREVDINFSVALALAVKINARGWQALLLPAGVPPGLRADAFVSIHVDYGAPDRRGWKLSPPWRASPASRALASALADAFRAAPELAEDLGHVSVNMRGYFAFNHRRFRHASSPYTPAVLVELGLLSNARDRALLTGRPGFFADLIMAGLEDYMKQHRRDKTSDLKPLELPWVEVAAGGAAIRRSPSREAAAAWSLEAGTVLLPVDVSGDWYEVFDRRRWATGWIRKDETVPSTDPRWPMPGEPGR